MAGLKGKHIFGLVTVGEKGQIVIPSEAGRSSISSRVTPVDARR